MAKPEKVAAVAEIADRFRESSAAVLTEYRGLSMAQLTDLRRALGEDTTYAIVKNTLTKRAASDAGYGNLEELLNGPTAIAFVTGDPARATKGLRDFSRTNPLLVIKGGVMEGRALTAAEFGEIAELGSREELLGRVAGVMKAKLSQAASMFAQPASQVARLAAALEQKRAAEQPASGAETPANAEASESTETAGE